MLGDGGSGHAVRFHDVNGTTVAELACNDVRNITWSRELSEVSRVEVTGGTAAAPQIPEDVHEWVHHASVFRDGEFVWSGVAQVVDFDDDEWRVTVRDPGTYQWRTRTPITRIWSDTDPVRIAGELWEAMFGLHGLAQADPHLYFSTVTYDFSATRDRRMMHQVTEDLVRLGIDWTVHAGRPVIMPATQVPELTAPTGFADCDFAERLRVRRDGTRLFTDVMVKGQNFAANATQELGGLRLQDIVAMDDLFGQANVRRAATQLVARRAAPRLEVHVPAGATLSPDAQVTINELMPGVVFPVHTSLGGGISAYRRLEKVEVTQDANGERVAVTLGEVPDQPDEAVFG
ncbi:NADH-quinone oxidoreductase subunit NuoG [Hoyosella altamirensis]|uniref:NADH-quinone oxidoreductase subunit NuoG n=1 Tax=Hoyosella altamirensis TaxID=616997 RepID=UPI0007DB4110|nr:NADH-quinone oxidoreductase subunit NuoG [Hoyosella altamirensis]